MHDPAWDPGAVAWCAGGADREFPGADAVAIDWSRDDPDHAALLGWVAALAMAAWLALPRARPDVTSADRSPASSPAPPGAAR